MNTLKIIIDKVIERLKTVPEYQTVNFYKNPFRVIDDKKLPCIKVGMLSGNGTMYDNEISYNHTDILAVAYVAQGNDETLEDGLYQQRDTIMDFLIKDANNSGDSDSLYHVINELFYKSWDMDLQASAEVGTGGVMLKFDLKHITQHIATFEDLNKIEIEAKLKTATDDTKPAFTESIDLPTT